MVRLLLKHHASPTAVFSVGPESRSPLDYAKEKRKTSVIPVLEEWIATHKDEPPAVAAASGLDFLDNGGESDCAMFSLVAHRARRGRT